MPPWLPSFPPKAFPTEVSSLHPLRLAPHGQQLTLLWVCSPTPMVQLSASECSRGLVSLSGVYRAVARFVVDYHSIQTVTDELLHSPMAQMLSLHPKCLSQCGDLTPTSVPPLPGCRSNPAHSSSSFLPSCILLLHGSIYSFPVVRDFFQLSPVL